MLSLEINFSWTISYLMPFVLVIFLSVILAIALLRDPQDKNAVRKMFFTFLIIGIPFAIAFYLSPIYEGDLSKEGKKVTSTTKINEFKNYDFIVLTIPGCPFCLESVSKVNLIHKRNPKLKIKYIVCSSNILAKNELRGLLNSGIKIDLGYNLSELVELSDGKFPCFVKIDHSKAIYKWHNNQFGTRAKDWIESNEF